MDERPPIAIILLVVGINFYISIKVAQFLFFWLIGDAPDPLLWADGSITW